MQSSDETVATADATTTKGSGSNLVTSAITVNGVGYGSATITVATPSGDEREFPVGRRSWLPRAIRR